MRKKEHIHNYELQGNFELLSMKTFQEENPELLHNPFRTNSYHIMIPFNHVDNHLLDFNKVSLQPYSIFFTPKNKIHYFKSTSVDMTAMCDMVFLILNFFISSL